MGSFQQPPPSLAGEGWGGGWFAMIRRILAGMLALLLILGGAFYLYLRSSLPQVEGRIAVRGLKAEVTIARDGDGVPLITAANDEDAAFGLGFAHAQERRR